MRLLGGSSEPEQALRASGASFSRVLKGGTTTADRSTNAATGAEDSSVWKFRLDEMVHGSELSGISGDQSHKTSMRTDFLVIMLRRENLRSLIQIELLSAIEVTQREKMRNMSRNNVQEIVRDVFSTGNCVAIEDIENFFFSFVEKVSTKVNHREVLDETLSHSSNRWSRSDTFTQILVAKFVRNSDFIKPIAPLSGNA